MKNIPVLLRVGYLSYHRVTLKRVCWRANKYEKTQCRRVSCFRFFGVFLASKTSIFFFKISFINVKRYIFFQRQTLKSDYVSHLTVELCLL